MRNTQGAYIEAQKDLLSSLANQKISSRDECRPLHARRSKGKILMNKTIWMLWLQGRQSAPLLVQRCIESWEEKNPEWRVDCLDAQSLQRFIDIKSYVDLETQSVIPAHLADIIRVALLNKFGGVWADATTYCNRPLDEWLTFHMDCGFFAFTMMPHDKRPISNWFLASEPGGDIIAACDSSVKKYWARRKKAHHYFWFHREFHRLIHEDRTIRRAWKTASKISADGPHSVFHAGYDKAKRKVAHKIDWNAPLFKLSHRGSDTLLQQDTILRDIVLRDPSLSGRRTDPPIETKQQGHKLSADTLNSLGPLAPSQSLTPPKRRRIQLMMKKIAYLVFHPRVTWRSAR